MSVLTLKVGTVTKTLAAWGVRAASLSLVNGSTGGLSLTTDEDIAAAPQWATEDAVELYLDTARVWAGKIVPPRARANGRTDGKTYRAADPTWWLAHLNYLQPWTVPPVTEGDPPTIFYFGRVFVFGATTTGDIITSAVQYAIDSTPVGAPITIGSISGVNLSPPLQAAENRNGLQMIQRCLELQLDAVAWWDYGTGGPPAFHCARYADLATVTIDASPSATSSSEISMEQAYEQAVPFVRIRVKFQTPATLPATGYRTTFSDILLPDGYSGTLFGGLDVSIDGDAIFGVDAATAAATALFAAVNNIAWIGSLSSEGDLPNFSLRPGLKLNVTGLLPAYATMGALVQEVTHDLMNGTTNVTFGPMAHLAFTDLKALAGILSGPQPNSNQVTERDTGGSPGETFGFDRKDKKDDGAGDFTFDFCTIQGWSQLRLKAGIVASGAAPGSGAQIPTVTGGVGGWTGLPDLGPAIIVAATAPIHVEFDVTLHKYTLSLPDYTEEHVEWCQPSGVPISGLVITKLDP